MEERIGWGEAIGVAWGNLTGVNNGGSTRTIRALFILIFLLGTAWAGYNYINAQTLLDSEKVYDPDPEPDRARLDKARLDRMVSEIKAISDIRSGSPAIAGTMEIVAKYPFGDPTIFRPDDIAQTTGPIIEQPVVVVDYPPVITVKAIMIMGNSQVAVMDIPDVGTGMLVKAGDTFSQRKGRVVRITPEKVVIRWGNKNWDIAPSF